MADSIVGRVLWRAVDSADVRRRLLSDLGSTLAEEGFILTDAEMWQLRDLWDTLAGLSERMAYERISAAARSYRR